MRFFCLCLASSSTSPPPPFAPRPPLSLSPLCRQVDGEWPSPVPLRRSLQPYSRIPRKRDVQHGSRARMGPNFLGTQPTPPRPHSHVTQQRWSGQPAICSSSWACPTNVTGRCRQCHSAAQSRNPLPRPLCATNLGRGRHGSLPSIALFALYPPKSFLSFVSFISSSSYYFSLSFSVAFPAVLSSVVTIVRPTLIARSPQGRFARLSTLRLTTISGIQSSTTLRLIPPVKETMQYPSPMNLDEISTDDQWHFKSAKPFQYRSHEWVLC